MAPGPWPSPSDQRERRDGGRLAVSRSEHNERSKCTSEVRVLCSTATAGGRFPSATQGGELIPRGAFTGKEEPSMETFDGNTGVRLGPGKVSTNRERIATLAREMPDKALTALCRYLDEDWLAAACARTRKARNCEVITPTTAGLGTTTACPRSFAPSRGVGISGCVAGAGLRTLPGRSSLLCRRCTLCRPRAFRRATGPSQA